ncbi:MAG: hypothetical protein DRQ88_10240 [Epsilonproteobacteria bacterium]|nr:MAG: hypothetical protein DRQ89_02970 [Campylobacterota bacterium]RLA64859.1 MAG: hypothetical protein DRQ88_10240 [Campylobacterota bacterium]
MALLSIVIPLGPTETGLQFLLKDLENISEIRKNCEVLIVGTKAIDSFNSKIENLKYLVSEIGRGVQLNFGAENAQGEYLWFLHADTRLKKSAYTKLLNSLLKNNEDIHYFNLKFLSQGTKMLINEWGVKLRSDFLGMPFGDQGIALKKGVFRRIGGFPQISGEDHHFIWQAKLKGFKLRNTDEKLYTSARKYEQNGWLRTTLGHLYLTFKQAIPYWAKILKG